MIEGVQDVSSVWRPYSGGTSVTSVSSITYTCLGNGFRANVGVREGGCRTFEDEDAIDAASSGMEGGSGQLLLSNGKCSCTESLSLEAVIEGSGRGGRGLDSLFGRNGSRGTSGSSLPLDVRFENNGVESDIGKEGEYEVGRVNIDECDIDGARLRADEEAGWYERRGCNDDEGAIVEGTIDGAL
jgi:hypothetical protein